jgi:hypothetical protein
VLVSVKLDGTARTADTLIVGVSIDGAAAKQSTVALPTGAGGGDLEVDFPGAYPAGKHGEFTVVATRQGAALGTGTFKETLAPGCDSVIVTVSGSSPDGGPDVPVGDAGRDGDASDRAGSDVSDRDGSDASDAGDAVSVELVPSLASPPDMPAVEAGACGAQAQPADYGKTCGSCGGTVKCDGTCTVATPANFGAACGSCGGTVKCDGTCTVATPANFGATCGSCGGKIKCDGTCSVATPANYGAGCGSCGGTVQCSGTCSVATPGNYGAGCGSCGGTVQCNGTCSVATPGNYGAGCGSCGGTVRCDGSCSVATPGNYNQACNSCGGTVQCNGTCSPGQPGNYGAACGCGGTIMCNGACSITSLSPMYASIGDSFACCYIDEVRSYGFGGRNTSGCQPGYHLTDCGAPKSSGGGSVTVVGTDSANCTCQVHINNNGLEGATFTVNLTQGCP